MHDELTHIDNLIAIKRWKMALERIVKALAFEPEDAELHLRMAIVHSSTLKVGEAEKAIRRAVRLSPDDGRMYNMLSIVLQQQGRYAESEKALNEAHRLEPERAYFFANHVDLSWCLEQNEQALAHAREAIRLDPTKALHHLLAAQTYQRMHRPEYALEHCKQALRLDPESADTLKEYGKTLCALGRHREAIQPLLSAMRMDPHDAGVHEALIESMRSRHRLLRWLPMRSLLARRSLDESGIGCIFMALLFVMPWVVVLGLMLFPKHIRDSYDFLITAFVGLGVSLLLLRMLVRFSMVALLQFDREARPFLRTRDRLAGNGAVAIFLLTPVCIFVFMQWDLEIAMGLSAVLLCVAYLFCQLFALRPGRSRRTFAMLLPLLLLVLIWSAHFALTSQNAAALTVPLALALLVTSVASSMIPQEDW